MHGLPPYPRHTPSPQPRNTSTSWNSEPAAQLSAFRARAKLSWLEETVLPRALQAQPWCTACLVGFHPSLAKTSCVSPS